MDVSQNRLTSLEGLGALLNLTQLNASKNFLSDGSTIQDISACPLLATIDISNNELDGEEAIVDALASAPGLLSLNLTGNPVMNTPQLRKKIIVRIPKLTYLDRPVFEAERLAAEAWGTGGREAEVEARAAYREAQVQNSNYKPCRTNTNPYRKTHPTTL